MHARLQGARVESVMMPMYFIVEARLSPPQSLSKWSPSGVRFDTFEHAERAAKRLERYMARNHIEGAVRVRGVDE